MNAPVINDIGEDDVDLAMPDGAYLRDPKDRGRLQLIVVGPMQPPQFYLDALELQLGDRLEFVRCDFLTAADPACEQEIMGRGFASIILRRQR